MSTKIHVCIHGHFYQPPRENPWLEAIEPQESAAPYPNWNARINAECYRPNAAARIVDGSGSILRIVNNYARISFNFGPTLLSWLAQEAPDVHQALVAADQASCARFGGHGNAIAQAYSHLIMPLANRRDQRTQALWGVRDFEHHFGRKPEGMWLPETAVDLDSLEALADAGIAYTVLAPHQAAAVRPLAPEGASARAAGWRTVHADSVDTGQAYRVALPSGRSIDVFFYDGPTSRAVAFERLLVDGARFAARIVQGADAGGEPRLRHISTDGETYGHHHRYGDMALAFALDSLDARPEVTLTNYGEFLARYPARLEAKIHERTAWSCAHGVGRWTDDCGCNSGGQPDWNQRWRRPLREALDWLRDVAADIFEREGGTLFDDPWAARDAYVAVILDRRAEVVDAFFAAQLRSDRAADGEAVRRGLELLEMQRYAMLMYTSCGWFFDELSGIETVQIIQYAGRVVELAERLTGASIEEDFAGRLARAPGNTARFADGRRVYEHFVRPARVELAGVAGHYAVSTLLEDERSAAHLYCYRIEPLVSTQRQTGKARLVTGVLRCTSLITRETALYAFAALHLGEHHLVGGGKPVSSIEDAAADRARIHAAFDNADLMATQRELDRHFPELEFSLKSLFRVDRDRVLGRLLESPLAEAEAAYRRLYAHNAPLMRYLTALGITMPEAFQTGAAYVLRQRIRHLLEVPYPSMAELRLAIDEAVNVGVGLDRPSLAYVWSKTVDRAVERVEAAPNDLTDQALVVALVELARSLDVELDLWRAQNEIYFLRERLMKELAAGDDAAAGERWLSLAELCRAVQVAPPSPRR